MISPQTYLFLALFLIALKKKKITCLNRFNKLYLNLYCIQYIQSLDTFDFETTLPMQNFISHVISSSCLLKKGSRKKSKMVIRSTS